MIYGLLSTKTKICILRGATNHPKYKQKRIFGSRINSNSSILKEKYLSCGI